MNFRIEYNPKTKERITGRKKVSIIGKMVAITGALPGMNRTQAIHWLSLKKARYSGLVDYRVNYLIEGKSKANGVKSSKVVLAQKYHIPIIEFSEVE